MNKKDYYEILEASKTATQEEIKSSFRKLAKKYHPDVSKEPNAAEKFKEAQEAYAILSDDGKRKQYDQFGHAAFDNNQGGQGGFNGGGFDFNGFDFGDIFGDLFGSSFGRSSNRASRGSDTIMKVDLTFEEAIFGTSKDINVEYLEKCDDCEGKGGHGEEKCSECHGTGAINVEQRTIFGSFATRTTCPKCNGKGVSYRDICNTCKGKGKIKINKRVTVQVPAGVDSGNQQRVGGYGNPGANGGPNGDLYLEYRVKKHIIFERTENDIYLELPITVTEAILGCKKEIPTITGNVKLTIEPGTNTGDKLRLRGKGVDDVHGYHKGDMYIVIKVVMPNKLTKDQKRLLELLSETELENSDFKKIKDYMRNI
jgi:molecular chaperone DnaJ